MDVRSYLLSLKDLAARFFLNYNYYIVIGSLIVIAYSLFLLVRDYVKNFHNTDQEDKPTPLPEVKEESKEVQEQDIKKDVSTQTEVKAVITEVEIPIAEVKSPIAEVKSPIVDNHFIPEVPSPVTESSENQQDDMYENIEDVTNMEIDQILDIKKEPTHVEKLEQSRKEESKKGFISKYFFGQ